MANGSNVPPLARNPEQRLISEYLVEKFPAFRHATRVAVGPAVVAGSSIADQAAALKASRPWRLEVDALVWWDGVLVLIEGKVKEYLNGLAKLPVYAGLIPQTPELRDYWGWEIRMRLVVPQANESLLAAAAVAGVEVDTFSPDWMAEYWAYRDRYWTADHRRARDELAAARRAAGLG